MARTKTNDRMSGFLGKSVDPYFVAVRSLLQDWLHHAPDRQRGDWEARLKGDDGPFESAFWEIYLHEVYRRSGYDVLCHPEVPSSQHRPDFLIDGGDEPFYLEACTVQRPDALRARDNRLDVVYQALRSHMVDLPFRVWLSQRAVGASSPSTADLAAAIVRWLQTLDYTAVRRDYDAGGVTSVPVTLWDSGGWELELRALPGPADEEHPLVTGWGDAEPSLVENAAPLLKALERKVNRYGFLDHPLVLAVLASTRFETAPYDIERALYGLHLPHPPDEVPDSSSLQADGFWINGRGLRRKHVPQVITAAHLSPLHITAQPILWPHPDPDSRSPCQPQLLHRARLGPLRFEDAGATAFDYFDLDSVLPG